MMRHTCWGEYAEGTAWVTGRTGVSGPCSQGAKETQSWKCAMFGKGHLQ